MPHLDPVVLGDSDALEVGEWVLAVGNQFQLGQTVTAGIVSAKSRRMNAQISGPYDNFIQTDASINPGSSGGPLFNTKGEVVGINTAIFSPGRSQYGSGFNIGIGFSIPMNMAKSIIGQLRDKGKVTRGMLGVIIQPIDAEMGEAMGYESLDGALVAHIVPGSPAERAGFRLKDIILSFNGSPIRDHDDLPILVASTNIGQEVVVEVLRGGEQETVTATIAELDNKAFPGLEQKEEKQIEIYNAIGLQTEAISKELADSLSIDKESGVVVTKINPGSSSERAGIQRGDIVVELANAPISDSTTLDSIAKKLEIGKPTLVLIRKKEGTRFLVIKRREKDAEVVGKDATKAN
jgi:serine protease Do